VLVVFGVRKLYGDARYAAGHNERQFAIGLMVDIGNGSAQNHIGLQFLGAAIDWI
jgi:hypothetical protein